MLKLFPVTSRHVPLIITFLYVLRKKCLLDVTRFCDQEKITTVLKVQRQLKLRILCIRKALTDDARNKGGI